MEAANLIRKENIDLEGPNLEDIIGEESKENALEKWHAETNAKFPVARVIYHHDVEIVRQVEEIFEMKYQKLKRKYKL